MTHMSLVLLGAVLILIGVLFMVGQPLWHGRLSGGKQFPTGTPKDTLEPRQTWRRLWDQIKLARSHPLRGRCRPPGCRGGHLICPEGVAVTRWLRKTRLPRLYCPARFASANSIA